MVAHTPNRPELCSVLCLPPPIYKMGSLPPRVLHRGSGDNLTTVNTLNVSEGYVCRCSNLQSHYSTVPLTESLLSALCCSGDSSHLIESHPQRESSRGTGLLCALYADVCGAQLTAGSLQTPVCE